MSESKKSYRQILRSTSLIGGSSFLNILIGLVRVKVLAVLLGPTGIGLAGLYGNIMGTAGTLVGLGIGTSGVRQIAEANGEQRTLAVVRRTLWYANLGLGIVGMVSLWLLREPVSRSVFGSSEESAAVGWLGIGVLLSMVAGSQTALLQGLRRIGDMARMNVIGVLISSITAICVVYWFGKAGVIYFVLVGPLVNVATAWFYTSKLPRPERVVDWQAMTRQVRVMVGLGMVFMATGLISSGLQLLVRSIVTRELGLAANGHFQAAWSISMTYISFVLAAMGADYYPRLTQAISDQEYANRIVNEQARVALLLAGPVLLGMLVFAPLVIHLLYAPTFSPAVEILRWQILGDLVKVASWPLGFILLARGAGRIFFLTELAWNASYLVSIWFGVTRFGLAVTGTAFLIAYILYFAVVYGVVSKTNGFRWNSGNLRLLGGLSLAAISIHVLSRFSPAWTYGVGSVLTAGMVLFSFYQISTLVQVGGLVGRLSQRFGIVLQRMGIVNV
ncbi:MAG: O-antigen translocase [Geobacteraceae bacterium]|nr:O-antigen translocase [Geobacteraceae bacterium]